MDELTETFSIITAIVFVGMILVLTLSKNRGLKGYTLGCFVCYGIATITVGTQPEPTPTYECPCDITELIQDEVIHYNKTTGDTTTTTYLDLSNCIRVKE